MEYWQCRLDYLAYPPFTCLGPFLLLLQPFLSTSSPFSSFLRSRENFKVAMYKIMVYCACVRYDYPKVRLNLTHFIPYVAVTLNPIWKS